MYPMEPSIPKKSANHHYSHNNLMFDSHFKRNPGLFSYPLLPSILAYE